MPGNTAPPSRSQSGGTTDAPWQPLADSAVGNPLYYHVVSDDMDTSLGVTGEWTQTKTTAGTIANVAGDGGLALFTTNASTPLSTDICSIQKPFAGFTLTAGYKLFFETSLQVSDAVNVAFRAGLIQTTATPFTATDGIYFDKPTGSAATLNIVSVIGSVATTVAVPAAAFTLANNTFIDLAFYLTHNGDILAFVDSNLVGFVPQSGSGTQTPPNTGPMARIVQPSLTTANLNPTVALQSGTGSSKTLTLDFVAALKER